MSNYKLLKIHLVKYAKCDPSVNIWNIFDSEHPEFIHAKRQNGEGMDPSYILFEKNNMNITLDTHKLPYLPFFKRRSIMFHYADFETNTVYQYSTFFGVLIAQKYSATSDHIDAEYYGMTRFDVRVIFHLEGFWKLLSPFLESHVRNWLEKTWDEDLIMKERRDFYLKLGFVDMKGLPDKIQDRVGIKQPVNLPVPRAMKKVTSHPLKYKNLFTLG